jgi:regulator of nonsense transcripts 1
VSARQSFDNQTSTEFTWPTAEPLFFLSVKAQDEVSTEGKASRMSYLNSGEAIRCVELVREMTLGGVTGGQIGVITPYDAQQARIRGMIDRAIGENDVEVANVDAFQGREKDFIILSCVRSNTMDLLGFLSDARRLNVALTRARFGLVIIGSPATLSAGRDLWKRLLAHYTERGLIFEGPFGALSRCEVFL